MPGVLQVLRVQRPLQLGSVLSQHRRQLLEVAVVASIPQEPQRLGPGPHRSLAPAPAAAFTAPRVCISAPAGCSHSQPWA